MIDLHCHILYGVDDGPKDKSQSLDMLSAALDAGFTHVVATPHFIHGTDFDIHAEQNKKQIEMLKEHASLPHLYLGSELFYDHQGDKHLEEKRATGINGGRYVLIEVPWENMHFNSLLKYIFQLEIAGYSVILAHPERYDFVHKDPNLLAALIKRDVLVQLSLTSLSGRYGKRVEKTARIMLEHDMVHMAASDAHKVEDYVESREMMERVEQMLGKEKVEELTKKNPKHILSNQVFYPESPIKVKKNPIISWIKKER